MLASSLSVMFTSDIPAVEARTSTVNARSKRIWSPDLLCEAQSMLVSEDTCGLRKQLRTFYAFGVCVRGLFLSGRESIVDMSTSVDRNSRVRR